MTPSSTPVPITPTTGVEVASGPLPAERVRDLVAEHGLVVVRRSGIAGAEGVAAFAAALGEVVPPPFLPEVRPGTGVSRLEHATSHQELKRRHGLVFASGWHADWSFLDEPPTLSLLWCEVAPEVGGETVFCDSSAALTAYSPPFTGFLRTLRAEHSSGDSFAAGGVYGSRPVIGASPASEGRESLRATHPVVRPSPLSGADCLFVNPAYTTHVPGLTATESRAVLETVYATLFWDEHVVRLRWSPDTLVVWDNTRLLHRAVNHGVVGARRIYRANVRHHHGAQ